MIRTCFLVLLSVGFMACSDGSNTENPLPNEGKDKSLHSYPRESGLIRFVSEYNLQKEDTTFLVIANNKQCNCGAANIFEVDSMVSLYGQYPTVWILNDEVPEFYAALSATDTLLLGKHIDLASYGFSGIYPQLFTLFKDQLIAYKKLVFKK